MKVVLDTNIFCRDFRMVGTSFRLLREGLHVVPADLKVPEVVVDEVVNRYREELEGVAATFAKSNKNLKRLLSNTVTEPPVDPHREAVAYRKFLLSALDQLGAEILAYPDVPHKTVVQRDLQRRSPFKPNGSGYRDFLIWESVRRLMSWGTERVVLVTANTKDFGQGPLVDPDLRQEIINPERLELVSSLEAFNNKFVVPKLNMAKDLQDSLQQGAASSFDIFQWPRENIVELLYDEKLGPIVVGFPDDVGSVKPSEILEFVAITIEDVRELSGTDRLVRVSVQVDMEFSVHIDWEDYVQFPEVRDWAGEAEEFTWSSANHVGRLNIEIELILDSAGQELLDHEIKAIDGDYAGVQFGFPAR